jgi:hypothetical protein
MTHTSGDIVPVLRRIGSEAPPSTANRATGTGTIAGATVRSTTIIRLRSGTETARAGTSGENPDRAGATAVTASSSPDRAQPASGQVVAGTFVARLPRFEVAACGFWSSRSAMTGAPRPMSYDVGRTEFRGGDGPGAAEEDWPRPSCRLEGDPVCRIA